MHFLRRSLMPALFPLQASEHTKFSTRRIPASPDADPDAIYIYIYIYINI